MAERVWIGSPNYRKGRNGQAIAGWVIHWMAGTLAGTDSIFQNRARNTSAHSGFEDNRIHDYVKKEDTAFHAGNWNINLTTLGYEVSAEPGRVPSDASYENLCQEIARDSRQFNLPITEARIRFHYQIVATRCNENIVKARIIERANQILAEGATPPVVAPAPIPAPPAVPKTGTATVKVDSLMVRSAPNTNAALAGSQVLKKGQSFQYTQAVQGQAVNGVSTWLQSTRGNYVWAGGTDYATTPSVSAPKAGTAQAIRVANVRAYPSLAAPLSGSRQLQPGATFVFSGVVNGQSVTANGITTSRWYRSTKGNYVWAGNVREV